VGDRGVAERERARRGDRVGNVGFDAQGALGIGDAIGNDEIDGRVHRLGGTLAA
jgi:hypothetical protein